MFQIDQRADFFAGIGLIDQDGPPFQKVAVPLDDEIDGRFQQGMAGADECGQGFARDGDQFLLEGDALVALQNGIAPSDLPVAVANHGRDVGDLVPLGLPLVDLAAQQLERFEEERCDEMRLEPSCVGPLHLLPDGPNAGDIHRIAGQRHGLRSVP